MPAPKGWTIEPGGLDWPLGLDDLNRVVADAVAPGAERAPARLYGYGSRGMVAGLDPATAVTMVGARRSTPQGRATAEELSASLAAAGLVIVSGMAFGIDSAAHRGALRANGRTVAVLAGGADVPYPPSARALHRRILESRCAVVSEVAPGSRPARWSFPARNRIMAALSAITILVEAAEPSGSCITANKALQLGREVCAVPGPIGSPLSAGPHSLIRDGAHLIRGPQDVLDLALGVGALSATRVGPDLDSDLAGVLGVVEAGAATSERVAARSVLGPAGVAVALARLELLGYLRAEGGLYLRTEVVPP